MSHAARIVGRIAGPGLLALAPTEALNMPIFAAQTAPVVYLNGTLLFIAGVAILQARPGWRDGWRRLVTLTGLVIAALGLARMAFPAAAVVGEGPGATAMLAALGALGLALTWVGYRPQPAP